MFALEIIVEDSLYAIKLNEPIADEFEDSAYESDPPSGMDELQRLFHNWNDIEYLEAFFEANKNDLQKNFMISSLLKKP